MIPNPRATLSTAQAQAPLWDVVVVGAGPAGALAARQTAKAGLTVLLVDKAAFPRAKVCGCCLNGAALTALDDVGLGDLPQRLGARPLHEFLLACGNRTARLTLPAGAALSREKLDAGLVEAAVAVGVQFLPQTRAVLGECRDRFRNLTLLQNNAATPVAARVVLAADGLAGGLVRSEPGFSITITKNTRLGAAALTDADAPHFAPETIHMACGTGGYVGVVRLEDRRLNIAAAFDPAFVKKAHGPAAAAGAILAEAGFAPIPELQTASWHGTPALTRRCNPPAANRVFVIGDASGYVEPFTGEGIAWALGSATAVIPLVQAAAANWRPTLARRWLETHKNLAGRRQTACRVLTRLLRMPRLTALAVAILARSPRVAAPYLQRLNRSFR